MSISSAEERSPKFIGDRLLKVALGVCGRVRALTFVLAYASSDTQAVGKSAFLDSSKKGADDSARERVAVRVNGCHYARGKDERRRLGSEECKVLGAYGRDMLNDNGERLLSFSVNHGLELLNAFFSTTKNTTSHTFIGRGIRMH